MFFSGLILGIAVVVVVIVVVLVVVVVIIIVVSTVVIDVFGIVIIVVFVRGSGEVWVIEEVDEVVEWVSVEGVVDGRGFSAWQPLIGNLDGNHFRLGELCGRVVEVDDFWRRSLVAEGVGKRRIR